MILSGKRSHTFRMQSWSQLVLTAQQVFHFQVIEMVFITTANHCAERSWGNVVLLSHPIMNLDSIMGNDDVPVWS